MNLKKISIDDIKNNFAEIKKFSIPLWRKNRDGKLVTIPLDKINQFFGNEKDENLSILIEENWSSRIKLSNDLKSDIIEESSAVPVLDDYGDKIVEYKNITIEGRYDLFEQNIRLLENISKQSSELDIGSLKTIVKVATAVFYIDKSTYDENMEESVQITDTQLRQIARKTIQFVEIILLVLRQNSISNKYIDQLNELSTGSTVDHMNNVFLRFVPFCNYMNHCFHKGSIPKIRMNFDRKFRHLYQRLMPGMDNVKLGNIFKGGLRQLNLDEMKLYALATMLHDIGKMGDIDYFEGSESYNRTIILKHALMGYNMILKAREFNNEVALIAALHHEYYNHPMGYGIMKALFPPKNYIFHDPEFCVSYDINDIKTGKAISYFPAKILEVVDVFDALTDSKRKYRAKENTTAEALRIMKDSFVDKDMKLDPIIFSIFSDFIMEHSEIG